MSARRTSWGYELYVLTRSGMDWKTSATKDVAQGVVTSYICFSEISIFPPPQDVMYVQYRTKRRTEYSHSAF